MCRFHSWNEGVTTLETKSLKCVKFIADEFVEAICPENSIKKDLLRVRTDWIELSRLNLISYPVALVSAWNVHVLDTNLLAVSVAQGVS